MASIINIASVSAVKGGGAIGNIWYGASKAAVVALTKGLSREFGPSGIRVNAIAPGVVETNMVKKAMTPEISRKVLARFPSWSTCDGGGCSKHRNISRFRYVNFRDRRNDCR
jgi:NAD(P)-dependent dehydrogenase (short-subunit alcohol dehydrogenase family)